MAKEGIRQRIKRGKREAARHRLEHQREFDERQAHDREEWDREMTELRERAQAELALETPEEQFERQQEHQRRLESARVRERLLLRYTLCVAGAVTTALVGGALVVIFGFVTRGPRGLAVVGLALAWLRWIPFAGRASSYKSDLLRG